MDSPDAVAVRLFPAGYPRRGGQLTSLRHAPSRDLSDIEALEDAGLALSAAAIVAAAWGKPVEDAILQELIDAALIFNALRVLR